MVSRCSLCASLCLPEAEACCGKRCPSEGVAFAPCPPTRPKSRPPPPFEGTWGSLARRRGMLASSHSNSSASLIRPYLMISADREQGQQERDGNRDD
ncbi:hypothetical protein F751_5850 [Auxenochlorella protothecoides]|uniref:Uncharacterized protein n=1 Tax=Auxenochlorella protothecoides TaxID=3075 RepID=A0A087SDI9_AUXPR|nr:hypothetical protein F751_5850 [Auxenochlorella protothecoides]KFM23793.1 hypothetical protein F751_5850 [Auxenochlorella protothecoides]